MIKKKHETFIISLVSGIHFVSFYLIRRREKEIKSEENYFGDIFLLLLMFYLVLLIIHYLNSSIVSKNAWRLFLLVFIVELIYLIKILSIVYF